MVEEKEFEKVDRLSERFCFDCLIIRPKNASHCKSCQSCIPFRHKHSRLFGTCIGSSNAQSYYLILVTSYLILSCYLLLVLTSYPCEGTVFSLLEGAVHHWEASKVMAIVHFVGVGGLVMVCFEEVCWMTTAVCRGATVREIMRVYDHKGCFEIKS